MPDGFLVPGSLILASPLPHPNTLAHCVAKIKQKHCTHLRFLILVYYKTPGSLLHENIAGAKSNATMQQEMHLPLLGNELSRDIWRREQHEQSYPLISDAMQYGRNLFMLRSSTLLTRRLAYLHIMRKQCVFSKRQ
jgi:hypothetical protein